MTTAGRSYEVGMICAPFFRSNLEVNGSVLGPDPRFNFHNSCGCMNSGIIEHPQENTISARLQSNKERQEDRYIADTLSIEGRNLRRGERKERSRGVQTWKGPVL